MEKEWIIMVKQIALLLISIILSGCVHPGIVKIYQKKSNGHYITGTGVVISKDAVITAKHVVKTSNKCIVRGHSLYGKLIFKKHKLPHWVKNYSNPEPIALLCPDSSYKFSKEDIFEIGTGEPYRAITLRGTFDWSSYEPIRGDSGSAVVNKKGELIGVLYGHRKDNTPVFLRVKKELIEYWRLNEKE